MKENLKSIYSKLGKVKNTLLKEETDFIELREALEEYKVILLELSGLNLENKENRTDLQLSSGKAIGTTWAAQCIDDLVRTKRFVKGLCTAVDEWKGIKKRTIHILYVGSGPFGTLVLPLFSEFSPEEIQVSIIEVNEVSCQSFRHLIDVLDYKDYIHSIDNVDATTFKLKDPEKIDIFLTETMQLGLEKEQQVPIVFSLVNQLNKEVVLIPENIKVSIGLLENFNVNKGQKETRSLKKFGTIFELNKETACAYLKMKVNQNNLQFPKLELVLSKSDLEGFFLAAITEIKVYGQEQIKLYESGITLPKVLDLGVISEEKLKVKIEYQLDPIPKIKYETCLID